MNENNNKKSEKWNISWYISDEPKLFIKNVSFFCLFYSKNIF